ncbi:hypothetical protein, variant [Aphanomyces invadans]|uniref:ApaG domain-containing protein n=1 Tax=Aphanomyces invadans TaxID=157072 RepID=A0A024U226_9STRA|nr:hypothetical protein, variant [Aphanomyces invadans]ETV99677.1 hypothetical protein, variant [Aphanomyces invadans]|eukprot:XP_008871453.1 hypothetical protein, variant [Aphanomyces invadans]
MRPSTIKALYKMLLRDVRKMAAAPGFRLRESLVPEQWGHGTLYPAARDPTTASSYLSGDEKARWTKLQRFLAPWRGQDIDFVELVRTKFRSGDPSHLDDLMWAVQEVSHQRLLAESSSVNKTDDILIEATGRYLPQHSDPSARRFRYTYRIRVFNEGTSTIRITGRHYIFDHGNQKREILPRHSPQVVGLTPTIKPGEMFEYASGVDLETIAGSVRGCLHAVRVEVDGSETEFDAIVAPFSLQPTVLDAMMLQ